MTATKAGAAAMTAGRLNINQHTSPSTHFYSFENCMTTMKRIGKWTLSLAGISLLAYVGYFYYSLVTGEERVTAICKQMTPGMSLDELIRMAKQHGLGPTVPRPDSKEAFLAELRSYGRHSCQVELENGVVKSARYRFFD